MLHETTRKHKQPSSARFTGSPSGSSVDASQPVAGEGSSTGLSLPAKDGDREGEADRVGQEANFQDKLEEEEKEAEKRRFEKVHTEEQEEEVEEPAVSAPTGDFVRLAEPVPGECTDFADTKDENNLEDDAWRPLPREATLEVQRTTAFPGEGSLLPEDPLRGKQVGGETRDLDRPRRRFKAGPRPHGQQRSGDYLRY